MLTINQEIEKIKGNYESTIDLVEGLPFSQKKQIRTIEFYNNSKYLNGQFDEKDQEKPFYNILNAICDVENSAKDLDTKDIQITSDDSNHYLGSFLLSKDIYVWMKEINFARTLNDMRDMHTRYGSLLVKKVTVDGVLTLELPEWKNLITDQVDILKGAIIETHWMTANEIQKMKGWKNKKEVLDKLKNGGSTKRLPVSEVRGEFSKATFKNTDGKRYTPSDENEYSYQLYYVAGNPVENGKATSVGAGIPMYWEDNTEKVYKYLARKPKAGRGFGVGVMEEGEEAQVGTNDAVLKQSRAMEYTTKVIATTASKKLKGRNLLSETEDGTILEIEENKDIKALQLLPSGGLQQYGLLINQWYDQLQKTTSAYASQRGDVPHSGTPFRLQATVLQQSSGVFQDLQEEIGIFITEIIEDWIMPYLGKKLTKEHILAYDFSSDELREIDSKFSTHWANQKTVNAVLEGKIVTRAEYDRWIEGADIYIKETKAQRFIDIPKDFYKNLKARVTVNVTGEQKNKAATLESLYNILVTYAASPNLAQDPVASELLTRIIELSGSGISPVSITGAINSKAKQALQSPEVSQAAQPVKQPVISKPLSLTAKGE